MQRIAVTSTDLRSVGYDAMSRVWEIEFHSGGIYQYRGVPPYLFDGLLGVGSKGRYFHAHIKGRYPYQGIR